MPCSEKLAAWDISLQLIVIELLIGMKSLQVQGVVFLLEHTSYLLQSNGKWWTTPPAAKQLSCVPAPIDISYFMDVLHINPLLHHPCHHHLHTYTYFHFLAFFSIYCYAENFYCTLKCLPMFLFHILV
jgi:hypothetical protein